MAFNTVTLHEITDDFGDTEKFRLVLNTGTHEYHVTDIAEFSDREDAISFAKTAWSFAEFVIGHTM
ncbi:hypothetical protein CkP1_0144 [Citrobacter phage CkP1]|nr:hypothetical protein CkP1_0144 [Citrobacter phage CkP1]